MITKDQTEMLRNYEMPVRAMAASHVRFTLMNCSTEREGQQDARIQVPTRYDGVYERVYQELDR